MPGQVSQLFFAEGVDFFVCTHCSAARDVTEIVKMAEMICEMRQSSSLTKSVTFPGMNETASPASTAPKPRNLEVDRLLAASGRTQEAAAAYIARRIGRDFANYHLSRILNCTRNIRADEMDALRELAAQPADGAPAAPRLTETEEVVPLFGYANGAGSVLRITGDDQRVGVVPIHPAQRGSRSAFAFIAFGDSVSPRLHHGEIGYAIRNRPPFRGQLCVIEKADGEALVKFYERQDERTLFVSQLQPKKSDIAIPLKDVRAVHAVVGASFGPG